jgi:hypothetical protein
MLDERRNGNHADRGSVRDARARNRRKERAAQHCPRRHAPGHVPHERVDEREEFVADPGLHQDAAHQNEQRYGKQHEAVGRRIQDLGNDLQRLVREDQADGSRDAESKGDRKPEHEQST